MIRLPPSVPRPDPRFPSTTLFRLCTLPPFLSNPVCAEIAALSVPEQARVMADEGFKARLLEAAGSGKVRKLGGGLIGRFEAMYELGDPPDYEPDRKSTRLNSSH